MKKILLSISALMLSMASYAQPFFTETTYKGAFGSTDWTSGWSNFNPQQADYSGTTTEIINADITSNKTISGIVSLVNKVYVTNNAELTILPGTIIKGDKTTKSALIITRGSKIHAVGTVSQPIVFTSAFNAGNRGVGDWGGLVILGSAPNNVPATTTVGANGFPVIEGGFDATKANYGGNNPSDNSGELKYVRIEFGGVVFSSNDEINGLTMGSVGSATGIDYVQVSYANDDAFEWFGGNVNCKHLISFSNIDDDLDCDFGYQGNIQFALIIRDATLADQAGDSNGLEHDNNAAGNSATPQTKPIFSNVTAIGPYKGSTSNTIDAKFNLGLRLRRNTGSSIMNSIFTDFKTGLRLEGTNTQANYITNNTAKFENNIFAGNGTDFFSNSIDGVFFQTAAYNNTSLGSTMDAANIYSNPYTLPNPSFALVANSPAESGASFASSIFAGKLIPIALVSSTITGANSVTIGGSSTYMVSGYSPANATTIVSTMWYSSNTLVATIDGVSGVLTPLSVGTTNVYAEHNNPANTSITSNIINVTVVSPIVSLISATINGFSSALVNGTVQFNVSGYTPSNATLPVSTIWYSSNPSVATINSITGLLTAVSIGTTNVFAKHYNPGVGTITSTVIVLNVVTNITALTSATISGITSLTTGGTTTYMVNGYSPANATTVVSTMWYSSNKNVATIDGVSGVLTPLTNGTTDVFAIHNNPANSTISSNIISVSVIMPIITLTSSTITGASSLTLGGTTTYMVSGYSPSNATLPVSTIWYSSNPAVATINSVTGVLTAISLGTTNVTAKHFNPANVTITSNTIVVNVVTSLTGFSSDFNSSNLEFSISPNPTSDVFSIYSSASVILVNVFNTTGSLIATSETSNVSLANAPSGLYIVEVKTSMGVKRKTIVKY